MKTKLDEIIVSKRRELSAKKKTRSFLGAVLHSKIGNISVIAEIKLSSPSAGKLGDSEELERRVVAYERGGADAISVVVDQKYFSGDLEFIRRIKNTVSLPVLAKDFIIDPYQIYEMKAYGADAVLLIAKILSKDQLKEFVRLSSDAGLEPVVEVNNEKELQNAIQTDTRIIAVNARNLDTFNVNIDRACKLIRPIPKKFVVLGFSGVSTESEIGKYKKAGANGVLIGTSLMRSENPRRLITDLKNI